PRKQPQEPIGSEHQKQCLAALPETGAPARCCSGAPRGWGSRSGPVFGAPFCLSMPVKTKLIWNGNCEVQGERVAPLWVTLPSCTSVSYRIAESERQIQSEKHRLAEKVKPMTIAKIHGAEFPIRKIFSNDFNFRVP